MERLPGHAVDTLVVGAAIVDAAGRLLAAQRATPPDLAGRWELPGGKVEPGEDARDALVRECREELGVTVTLGDRIGGDWPIGNGGVLRVWLARVLRGEPRSLEHTAVRWLTVDELFDVTWLPADLPCVQAVGRLLRRRGTCQVPGVAPQSRPRPRNDTSG